MNENKWTKNKIEVISNLSNINEFPNLLDEWFVDECMDINFNQNSICNLCGKKHLKFEYFIQNKITDNEMLIGSDCINLFFDKVNAIQIKANNELLIIKKSELRQHLDRLFRLKIIKEIENIELVSNFEKSFYPDILEYLKDGKDMSPSQGMNLMRLVSEKIDNDGDFLKRVGSIVKINLRKQRNINQLSEMMRDEIIMLAGNGKYLKYILSKEQKEKINFDKYFF